MDWKTGGLLWLALIYLLIAGSAFASSSHFASVHSGLYKDKIFAKASTAFTPYEKIYLLVEFQQLQPGTFTLTTDWLTPWGKLEHQSNYSFENNIQLTQSDVSKEKAHLLYMSKCLILAYKDYL